MRTILLALLFGVSNLVHALEFDVAERYPNGLPKITKISGEIVAGDYERFLEYVTKPSAVTGFPVGHLSLALITLNSSGGNVLEAMKIATQLKAFYPLISAEGDCTSACLLLWMAGAQRHVGLKGGNGRIGVHRPTLPEDVTKRIPVKKLEELYKRMTIDFKAFVLEQGLPQSIYERLIATSSSEIYWLTKDDIRLIGSSPPYFSEKVLASCGKLMQQMSGSQDAGKKTVECINDLTSKERIRAIDELLGSRKPRGWAEYKERLLN